MPELPEVETFRLGLVDSVLGKVVEFIDVLWERMLATPRSALESVVGHRLADISRRGKVLIWRFDNGYHLLLHLRMTGQLVVTERGRRVLVGGHPSPSMLAAMPVRTTRAVIHLSDEVTVYINDLRKFARMWIVDARSLTTDPFLVRLGPEPLSDLFTVTSLQTQLRRHARAPIKAVLLDQSTVAGLGNIYTDEALHLARIHPLRPAGTLRAGEIRRLRASIRQVIATAIDYGGTTFIGDALASGTDLTWLARARVFQRQGQPCPVCGTPIQRIRVAGRGTNFCPRCQRDGGRQVTGQASAPATVLRAASPRSRLRRAS